MFSNIFSKFKKDKKTNCILVIPPLLEPTTFYTATPILTGQLINNGFNAKNLDLNIRFFRTILTKKYIKQTKKLLDKKNINYDKSRIEFLINNIESAIKRYKIDTNRNEDYYNSKKIIEETLELISSPYNNFNLKRLDGFEDCFNHLNNNFQYIKNISTDKENNIFYPIFENIVKEIKKQKINFVGITIPFPGTMIPAFTLSRLLKEKTKAHITIGGNFLKEENILNHPEILDIFCDSVLLGDGEESIVELVKSIENQQNLENVQGLIYKKYNKVYTNKTQAVTKMENLANISLEGINFDDYLLEYPHIYVMMSKGCYWGKCTFCALGPKYGRYSTKTPQKAVAQIKEIKEKYNITRNCFHFQDDAIHPNYLEKLADEIIKEDLNIYYVIFARFEKEFTRELFEKLYKSGLRAIYWGLESGSQKVLDGMNKGINIEDVPKILKDAHEVGITNMAGIIVNFPTETMDEYNETIKFLETVKDYVTISPGNFAVMKNSIVEQNSENYGIEILSYNEFDYCPVWKDKKISPELRLKKWNHFCECVKSGNYSIDTNKHL